ncbi:indolepyruvate ferredoxin oxidoreductase family protein [Dasania marina]|uniref:indolepyruvate ferredoxin oxidoreductase family protein n=1 Tax=Dasania marina TaxID=471499 RepID=UPI00035D2CE9|nr:indolepyruvate ferredoxin oxidoreductase family protein [Dasania marina]
MNSEQRDNGVAATDLHQYELQDRYRRQQGRVYLNGSQALVRLPLMQRQLDEAHGINSAGFISGYTGSPLGGYDIALKQAGEELKNHQIHFQPGINEDLAATSVWGSQQIDTVGDNKYDGVFSLWYGKGPGVDRSGDALKHGSYGGASEHGGVIVLAGDDHGAKSSTTAHQSDHAFIHFAMPYLNPASVQDYLDFGLYGFALSRYSGCWVGMKCVTDTIESSASVSVDLDDFDVVIPDDVELPEGGLNARGGLTAVMAEQRQYQHRLPAAQAFVRANKLDKVVVAPSSGKGKLGIVTSGKSYLDVMQALDELGLDLAHCAQLGIGIYKVAMPWPLEPVNSCEFVSHYDEVLVIEEKRPVMEEQLASLLVNLAQRPLLTGKRDESGQPLLSSTGELSPAVLVNIIAQRLQRLDPDFKTHLQLPSAQVQALPVKGQSLNRVPSFCAGCPHNTSTKVPEGSMAFGGIGCHGMATFLPERRTPTLFQMGGEGASWIGIAPFTERKHIFQNLGDGTYYHSGLLAIRAAVAAGVNITYKILVNDAIAMTGGQKIEGQMRVDILSRQLEAEGVQRIAVVGRDPKQYQQHRSGFADNVTLHQRDDLEIVQKDLRVVPGVTAIIYDQHCATELRRRRKRGTAEDPDQRIFINPRVCEGCGDCSVQSNCIAIEPVNTEYGRKRRINQSACNKDFSCVKGYCPSFISVLGGTPKQRGVASSGQGFDIVERVAQLPAPVCSDTARPYNVLITGIGGSGVVTLGALIGMAAFLEGKGCSVLDVAGLAQRNGPVTSHIRVANDPAAIYATRVSDADLVLGCDIVVAAGAEVLKKMHSGQTKVVINSCVAPTSDFASNPDLDLSAENMMTIIRQLLDEGDADFIAAGELATALMGNEVAANMFIIGYALQKGWMPVSLAALERAIELNGVAVAMNQRSLAWGRLAAVDLDAVQKVARPAEGVVSYMPAREEPKTLSALVDARVVDLTEYQNSAYADSYSQLVAEVKAAEQKLGAGELTLTWAVAQYYFKLMAYKDEYEVARLHSGKALREALAETFDGNFKLAFHLAPPVLGGRDPNTGRYPKRVFGGWMMHAFTLLAKFKFLRGSVFDPFGYASHRQQERQLIKDYAQTIRKLLPDLKADNYATAVAIAELPEKIRGYDTVKEANIAQVQLQQEQLLDEFYQPPSANNSAVKIMAVNVS